jgi:hypothetical protein
MSFAVRWTIKLRCSPLQRKHIRMQSLDPT